MTNDIVKDLKRQYEKEFASIFDLQRAYPELNRKEIVYLLEEEAGIKLSGKGTTTHRKKLRLRWQAEKIRPTPKQLETFMKQYGTVEKIWLMVFKEKGVHPGIVKEWVEEAGLKRKGWKKHMTKEERLRSILAKVSQ